MIKYGEVRSIDAKNYHNSNSNLLYTYLKHPITVDGIDYMVKIDIRRANVVNNFYIHKISAVETAKFPMETSKTFVSTADRQSISNNKENVNKKFKDNVKFSLKNIDDLKNAQLNIILVNNPAPDTYHTWIRNINDVKTFREVFFDDDYRYEDYDDSYTYEMKEKAMKTGKITVYSSKPIVQGTFVTPSKLEAIDYSGNNKVYSKEVNLYDVAWIDIGQGQYSYVENKDFLEKGIKFSLKENAKEVAQNENAIELNGILTDTLKGYTLDGYAISNAKISEISRNILKEYGTDKKEYSKKEMEAQLKQAYLNLREMIKNENISVSKLYDNFQEIAYNVVSNVNEIDSDEMDIVKPIQDYIRNCRIMVSDTIKNDITDYEAFRKQ